MQRLLLLGAAVLLASCGETQTGDHTASTPDAAAVEVGTNSDNAVSILDHPDRFADDADNDARRKPVESLAFFGLAEDNVKTVFEMEAGGGYFTELLSLSVGDDGSVTTQNPSQIMRFFEDALQKRFVDGRLTNVTRTETPFDALTAADGSIDLVTWIQGPHELFFIQPDGSTLGDAGATFAEIVRILKPGGAFVAIDHSTVEGAEDGTFTALHRIDKNRVVAMAEAVGLVLEAEGDFLANPEDDRTLGIINPEIRGKTDQFALRFRKSQ